MHPPRVALGVLKPQNVPQAWHVGPAWPCDQRILSGRDAGSPGHVWACLRGLRGWGGRGPLCHLTGHRKVVCGDMEENRTFSSRPWLQGSCPQPGRRTGVLAGLSVTVPGPLARGWFRRGPGMPSWSRRQSRGSSLLRKTQEEGLLKALARSCAWSHPWGCGCHRVQSRCPLRGKDNIPVTSRRWFQSDGPTLKLFSGEGPSAQFCSKRASACVHFPL